MSPLGRVFWYQMEEYHVVDWYEEKGQMYYWCHGVKSLGLTEEEVFHYLENPEFGTLDENLSLLSVAMKANDIEWVEKIKKRLAMFVKTPS